MFTSAMIGEWKSEDGATPAPSFSKNGERLGGGRQLKGGMEIEYLPLNEGGLDKYFLV